MYYCDYNINYQEEINKILEDSMKVNKNKIGNATVILDILPKGKVVPGTTMKPTSITVHQTGNIDTTARANHLYMKNCNKDGSRIASWHFTVDDVNIYQAIDTTKKAYHAGCASGNNTSIGIEICMFTNVAKQRKAYENAQALINMLMAEHGLNINNVKQHYYWTRKHCPAWLIEGHYGWDWNWFLEGLSNKEVHQDKLTGLVVINTDVLNVRSGPGTSYKVVTTVKRGEVYTIVQTQGNWGKLKSGAGWINLGYTKNK